MKQHAKFFLLASWLTVGVSQAEQATISVDKTEPKTMVMAVTTSAARMDHSHMPIEVPIQAAIPALSTSLSVDPMSGYNLELDVRNYHMMPPPEDMTMDDMMSAFTEPESGWLQGHAHLYVNGKKIQRVYGRYVHLPKTLFKPGTNSISVTLNNHGHMHWTVGGKKLLSTLFIDQGGDELVKHKFESFPATRTKR